MSRLYCAAEGHGFQEDDGLNAFLQAVTASAMIQNSASTLISHALQKVWTGWWNTPVFVRWSLRKLPVGDVFRGQARPSQIFTLQQFSQNGIVLIHSFRPRIFSEAFWQRLDQLKSKSTCKPLLPRCLEMPWISSQCLHIVKEAMVVVCCSENTAKTRVSFLMFSLWVLAVSGGQVSRQAGETVEVVVPPDLSPGDPFQVQMVQDWTVSKCFKTMLELSGVLWECKHWHDMSIVKLTGCSSPLDSAWLHLRKTMKNILVYNYWYVCASN